MADTTFTDQPDIDHLSLDEAELLDDILSEFGESRRHFLEQASVATLGAVVLEFLANKNALAGTEGGSECLRNWRGKRGCRRL